MSNPHVAALQTMACVAAAEHGLRRLRQQIADDVSQPWLTEQAERLESLLATLRQWLAAEAAGLGWPTLTLIGNLEAPAESDDGAAAD
jgi:hypothetical protein